MSIFKKDVMHLRSRKNKGFTLVELLVVIAIIGVLATLVLLQLGTARARARDTKRITDVNQIRTAIEQYFEDNNGQYPDAGSWETDIRKYLTNVPKDPLDTTKSYGYAVDTTKSKFQVWTTLEQTAAALSGDADIPAKSNGWNGSAADGDDSACKTDQTKCIYDQGVQ